MECRPRDRKVSRVSLLPSFNATYHAVNHHTAVLRTILAPPTNMSLDHVPSIEERHLSIRLDPELVPGIWRNNGKAGDVQPELASLGELANHGSDGQKVRSGNRHGQVGQLQRHVVYSVSMESEDKSLRLILSRCDEVIERATSVVRQLGEDCIRKHQ